MGNLKEELGADIYEYYRENYGDTYTTGKVLYRGKFICYALEDVVRHPDAKKVYGETAISAGLYKMVLTMSNRFKRLLPEILNVPNFLGVRVHRGNTAEHSHGCLIVGMSLKPGFVGDSKTAEALFIKHMGDNGVKGIRIIDTKASSAGL